MQTKLKLHRGRVVIYYSFQKKNYRERTSLIIPKKDEDRIRRILNKNTIPAKLESEMGPILDKKAYYDSILAHLLKKNNRIPTVKEFKKMIEKKPINLNETKVVPLYKEHLEETEERFRKGTNSITSIKDYKSFFNLLKDYELENNTVLEYSDLTSDFVTDLFGFMRKKRINTIHKQYRTVGSLKGSTIKKRFDNLKFFTKWLEKKLDFEYHKEVRAAISDFDLTKEEINPPIKRYALDRVALEHLKSSEPQTKNEQIAKDIFIISCYTSLRFSDLVSLKKTHLKFNVNKFEINKRAVKTSAKMVIPMKDEIYELYKKYDFNLDRLSNGILNKSLKNLLARNIFFQQESEYYKDDGTPYLLHEIISCHTGRRTMISRLLNEFSITPSTVMNISGHKSIDSLNKYICPDGVKLDMNLL